MSILDSFDQNGTEIIRPAFCAPLENRLPETVVSVFTQRFADLVADKMHPIETARLFGGRVVPIYSVRYSGKDIGFYHSLLGASAGAALLEELIAGGVKKVLFFGSCGSLDRTLTDAQLLVPTAAYRDEGTSYHYAPPSDYIPVNTSDRLSTVFDELGVPYIKTKTWTTDAFYRETVKNADARRREGCLAVEMECAALVAVGAFRNVGVYEFLYTADCIDGGCWDRRMLGSMPDDMCERILKIAFETALRL